MTGQNLYIPEALKAMRSAYRKMSNVQRVMVLTLLHLLSEVLCLDIYYPSTKGTR